MRMYDLPDSRGHFGPYGGVFVAETLIHALDELKQAYARYQNDPEFLAEFEYELKHYVGRPSPVYHAKAAAPAESPRHAAEPAKAPGAYVVQVAALSDAAKAKQLQKQMSGVGVETYTEVVSTKTGDVTRVRAGPFATREAAEKARVQLKKAGLDGHVVPK